MKFLTFVGLAVILICALYFARDGGPELFERGAGQKSGQRPTFMREVELREYQNDKMRWKFKAFEASLYEDNAILMKKLELEARLNNSDKDLMIIKADSGKLEGDHETAVVWGNARVEFDDNRKLFARRLFIDRKKQIIYSLDDIKMVSDQDTVKAESMVYNLKTGLLTIRKPRVEIILERRPKKAS